MQRQKYLCLTLCLVILANFLFITAAFSQGGIATDGTLGLPAHIISPPNSANPVVIKQDEGITKGANLFHSFSQFNIGTGQTVTFAETKTNSLANVISRVTGGSGSDLDGRLQVTPGGHANFYLINPNGVTFGPGAQVDVPGSIHVSTADQLKLTDGKVFSAIHPAGNSLSSAAPAAFGFLGTSTTNNGLLKIDSSGLQISQGKAFDAVAGQIIIENNSNIPALNILITQGEVRLIASRGSADISVVPNNNGNLPIPTATPTTTNAGDILLKNASIYIDGAGGGRVGIWGGKITLGNSSSIFVDNSGAINPGKDKGIAIHSNSMSLQKSAEIFTNTALNSSGKSADINIITSENLVLNNGKIQTASVGTNNSGNINIVSGGDVIVKNVGQISTAIFLTGDIKGGDINISAGRNIRLESGGAILTKHNDGNGGLGNIALKAEGDITVTGSFLSFFPSGIFATTSSGAKAGDIFIVARGNINILDGGQVDSSTFAKGQGGTVSIKGARININNAQISAASKTADSGKPGNIVLSATESLNLEKGKISIENNSEKARTNSLNSLSSLSVSANNINLKDSTITTQAIGNQPAGAIAINFDNILCLDSSFITTEANQGNGGDIAVKGGDVIEFKNAGFLTTVHGEQGNGGNINVSADNLVMKTGLIQANTSALNAKGGNINLDLKALIPRGNQLIIGGQDSIVWRPGRFGLNVIQAAAPNGLNGSIQSTAPALNLSGSLSNLGNPEFNTTALRTSYCSLGTGSSLTRSGKGGLIPKGRDAWVY